MQKRWRIRSYDENQVATYAKELSVPRPIARLLIARGLTKPDDANAFLNPKLTDLRDPDELPGVVKASQVIFDAIQKGKKILVYGDYDVDGMTGTAILIRCLKLIGAENVTYHVPQRENEDYGLNSNTIDEKAQAGVEVMISVDCGISAIEEAKIAQKLGIQLVITDHHPPKATLPVAAAIVHPNLPGYNYPFHALSGSGVALKLAWSLSRHACGSKKVNERMRSFLLQAVGLAALGTVADVVPLIDENRVLVRHGLVALKNNPPVGFQAMLEQYEMHTSSVLTSEDLSFQIAPRLNAAGRVSQPRLGVEILSTEDMRRAINLAMQLDEFNSQRKGIEHGMYLSALKQIRETCDAENDPAFVLASDKFHSGMNGIVAGRIAEKYHRPVVVIALDGTGAKPGKGSARSIPGVDLNACLSACDEWLIEYGGHAAAAGVTINEFKIDEFRLAFARVVEQSASAEEFIPYLEIDGEFPLSAFNLDTVGQLDSLAPFGEGNSRPIWCACGVEILDGPKTMGQQKRHLQMKIKQYETIFRAVAFGKAEWEPELLKHEGLFDFAFKPVINEWRGRRNVELHLLDWKPSDVRRQTAPF